MLDNSMTYSKYTVKPIILMGFIVYLRAETTGVGQRPLTHVLPSIIFPLKGPPLASNAAIAYQAQRYRITLLLGRDELEGTSNSFTARRNRASVSESLIP